MFLQELISDPFATSGQHIKNLTGKLSKDGFFIFRNELLHDKLIYEVKIKLDAEREAKFLYPDADQAGRIMKIIFGDLNQGQVGEREDFRIMDRKTYVSLLLRRLTKTALRRYRIRFDEDENGLLIKDRKVYITFMHDVMSILKLLETSFSRVIDVISDDVNQVMVINDVLRMNTGQPIGALRVANIRDLESALFN